ncbi:hypothetical protein E0H46_17775 [Rhizobium leguminosarum bv. viciae]|nr:hypothetical protein E0H46_17775 [Rhizobium leguminosarum bv. viciae]
MAFLDAAANIGLIERREIFSCPACNEAIEAEAAAEELCPLCGEAFVDRGEVRRKFVYRLDVRGTRDIPWIVVIHGFNTNGEWQQDFSWRMGNKLKYSAPVLIYKYGLIRFSVLVRWRHRQLARQLGTAIRRVRESQPDTRTAGRGSPQFRKPVVRPVARYARIRRPEIRARYSRRHCDPPGLQLDRAHISRPP